MKTPLQAKPVSRHRARTVIEKVKSSGRRQPQARTHRGDPEPPRGERPHLPQADLIGGAAACVRDPEGGRQAVPARG